MDSGQDYLDSEFLQTGQCLLKLLQSGLCPDYVRDADNILLTVPWEEADFRVGIYLYDIQDYSAAITGETVISDEERRFPPKAVELCYMVFCNEKHRFGGVQREQVHAVLNEITRSIYDNPVMEREDGESVQFSFLRESVEFKIRLWGSFNQPLQPAIYVRAVPVLVQSRRSRKAVGVRSRDFDVKRV